MDGQTKINKADNSEIIKPKGKDVTVYRDTAADGSGTYYGKLPSGVVEKIGGGTPTTEISASLYRDVAQDIKAPNSPLIKWNKSLFKRDITHDEAGPNPEEITIVKPGVYEIIVSYAVSSTQPQAEPPIP